jgi:RHS repeat-associated protein
MTYGVNSILTGKRYRKDADTEIREEYILHNSGLAVTEAKIYEIKGGSETLRQRISFQFDSENKVTSTNQNAFNITQERRYYGTDFTEYLSTVMAYDFANSYVSAPVATTSGGVTLRTTYDKMGRVLTQTDGIEGHVTDFSYDAVGRITKETHPDGTARTMEYVVNATQNFITSADELGHKSRLKHNPFGSVIEAVLLEEGGEILLRTCEYDAQNRLTSETAYDGRGAARNTTRYLYDHLDRVTEKSVYPGTANAGELAKSTTAYTDAVEGKYFVVTGTVLGDATAPAVVSSTKTDQRGRTVEQRSGDAVSRFTYDLSGNQLTAIDPLGHTVSREYDWAGRVVSETVPHEGGTVTAVTAYDELGRKTASRDFRGNGASFRYDDLSRLTRQESDFEGSARAVTEYTYDAAGNVLTQRSSCGEPGGAEAWRQTENLYDLRNRITDTILRDGSAEHRSRTVYDAAGNKVEVWSGMLGNSDAGSHKTRCTYDRFGNVLTSTDPTGQTETFAYDRTGRLLSKTDRNGDSITYSYDMLGRVTGETVSTANTVHSRSVTKSYEFAMTGAQKRVIRRDTDTKTGLSEATEIAYLYDKNGRVTRQTDPDGVVKTYAYDANGNRTAFTLTRNGVTEIALAYAYDARNRVTAVKKDGATLAAYAYDPNGNRLTLTLGNGVTTQYSYNKANLVTALSNGNISSYRYAYNLDGNQRSKAGTVRGVTKATGYAYDNFGRLVTETEGANTTAYTYDRFGNRAKLTKTGATPSETTYEYDPRNRLLTETKTAGSVTEITAYRYDKNGNQLQREHKKLAPESGSRGRISLVTDAFHETVATLEKREYTGLNELIWVYRDGEETLYRYRPDGLRFSKTFAKRNGETSTTVHHWNGQSIALETTGNGLVKSRFLRGVGLIAQQIDNQLHWYLHNAHGDVVQQTDSNLTVLSDYETDAFGVEKESNPLDPNPFRYCAEYLDSETGQIYLRNRYYDPGSGRFTSEDPIRSGGNWYAYCGGNPVAFVDPLGLARKSLDDVANDVIRGKYGNGQDRIDRLEDAGYNYRSVQDRVNQILYGGSGSGGKSRPGSSSRPSGNANRNPSTGGIPSLEDWYARIYGTAKTPTATIGPAPYISPGDRYINDIIQKSGILDKAVGGGDVLWGNPYIRIPDNTYRETVMQYRAYNMDAKLFLTINVKVVAGDRRYFDNTWGDSKLDKLDRDLENWGPLVDFIDKTPLSFASGFVGFTRGVDDLFSEVFGIPGPFTNPMERYIDAQFSGKNANEIRAIVVQSNVDYHHPDTGDIVTSRTIYPY